MRVFCFSWCIGSKFRSHRFPHDDGAGFLQQADDLAVLHRLAAGIKNGAVFRRQVLGIENIFNPNGNPMQRAKGFAGLPFGISGAGLFEGIIGE